MLNAWCDLGLDSGQEECGHMKLIFEQLFNFECGLQNSLQYSFSTKCFDFGYNVTVMYYNILFLGEYTHSLIQG